MNKVICLFILGAILFFNGTGICQTCSGNLGENIFLDGDFGKGSANVLLSDPQIAPGYRYSLSNPPQDGLYVIANSTNWPALYPTWLVIKDNSSDPNGYMMVVNASFSTGVFYEKTITGLCENTLYEFSADVINLIKTGVTGHIEPNVSFLLNDEIKFNTGNIPQSQQWNTYGFTFTTQSGQTTLKLSLRNNAPGGIGNDLALDNISFRPCGPEAFILPETIANICEDGNPIDLEATIVGSQYANPAFQWQSSLDGFSSWTNINGDSVYNHTDLSGGYYHYRYLLANSPGNLSNSKCRVISNVKTVFVQPKFYEIVDTICEGLSYKVGISSYNRTGVYIDSLLSSIGCDSIVTLHLTVLPDNGIEVDKTVHHPFCNGYSDGAIDINAIRNGYVPYRTTLGGNPIPSDNIFKELEAGLFDLEIVDRYGCRLLENIELLDPELFVMDLGDDRNIDLGDAIVLNPTTNYPQSTQQYLFAGVLVCDKQCDRFSWVPFDSGVLKVEGTSEAGCRASDSIFIKVKEIAKAYIPNAFTPNGDGVNDYFLVHAAQSNVKLIKLFQVFDRWGNLVFERSDFPPNDVQQGWDGRVQEKPAEQGTYVFRTDIQLLNDKIISRSGDFQLIRRQ